MSQDESHEAPPEEIIPEPSERGTAVLGLVFLAALGGMWSIIFVLMLQRAG